MNNLQQIKNSQSLDQQLRTKCEFLIHYLHKSEIIMFEKLLGFE